jgi:hypothetical protein
MYINIQIFIYIIVHTNIHKIAIGSKVNTNEVWVDAKINDKNEIGGKKRKYDR